MGELLYQQLQNHVVTNTFVKHLVLVKNYLVILYLSETGYRCERQGSILVHSENTLKEVPPLCISESLFSDSIPNSETGYRCEEQVSILVLSENSLKEVPL